MQTKLPDFLIIGAMKAGTTSLHDYLGKHPDIFTTNPKELHFFTSEIYNSKNIDWYKSFFVTNKKVAGTTPQNYTKCHIKEFSGVPERVYKHLPNIKLIYIVRNPIDRIASHYVEALSGAYAPKGGLNNYLEDLEKNHYVLTSKYYYQISQYLKYFSKDQILVVKSEDLLNNRLETLNEVFYFLGVNEIDNENLFNYERNTNTRKKLKTGFGKFLISKNSKLLRKIFPRSIKKKLKKCRLIKNLSYNKLKIEPISYNNKIRIIDFLNEDIKSLEIFSGKNLSDWLDI